jgi:6-phosphogluconolactonase
VLKHGTAYLSTDPANRFLLSASYGSGAVDVYALNASGVPTKWVAGRDEGRKNAHCVLPSPDGRFIYIPYVKETNALFQYRFDDATGDITPMEPLDVLPPSGTGPRHMVYHPKLPVLYFSNEQHLGVSVYDRDAEGRLKFRKVCDAVASDESKEGISSSDIVITPDGRFLFAGIRGHTRDFNWITRYRIDDSGDVTLLGRIPADKIPWGFALSPDGEYLVVTAYEGGSITAYRTTKDGDLVKAASIACDKNISDIVAR